MMKCLLDQKEDSEVVTLELISKLEVIFLDFLCTIEEGEGEDNEDTVDDEMSSGQKTVLPQ